MTEQPSRTPDEHRTSETHADDEKDGAAEVIETLAGPGPVEDPGAVDDDADAEPSSPASDTDAPPTL